MDYLKLNDNVVTCKIDLRPQYERITSETSDWYCEMFGMGNNLVLNPAKGREPNCFWRFFQYIVFGNKWIKKKGVTDGKET